MLLLLALAVALAAGGYWIVYSPLQQHLQAASDELGRQQGILARYHRLLAQEETLLSEYERLRSTKHNDDAPISQIDMIDRLQHLASGLVEFKSLRPLGAARPAAVPSALVVECDCVAEYDHLVELLYNIELGDRFLSLRSIAIVASPSEPGIVRAHFLVDNLEVP